MATTVGKGMLWTGIERFFVQGVSFVQGIVLARLLCPEDFGLAAMLGVFLAVGATLAEGGLGSALVVQEFAACGRAIERRVLAWNLGVGAALYLLLALAAPAIARFYDQPALCALTWVMGLSFVLNAAGSVATARLTRELRFGALAWANGLSTLVAAAVAIALALRGAGVWSVAVLGPSLAGTRTALVWAFEKGCCRAPEDNPCAPGRPVHFGDLLRYGLKLTASGLVHGVYLNLYELALGKMLNPAAVGLYNRANGWMTATRNFVNPTVERVAFPVLAQEQGTAHARSLRLFLLLNVALLWPGLVVLWVWAPEIVGFVFGEQWLASVPYLRILVAGQLCTPFGNVALNALRAWGRADLVLKTDAVKKPLGLTALACGLPFGIVGVCWAKSASDFFEAAVDVWYVVKATRPARARGCTPLAASEPIDLVYLWYGAKTPPEGVDKCRACDNGELYWSLKSVDKFAPWFRKIFVLVNEGTSIPDWLSSNPRVKAVPLGRFVEADALPLNNSASIEMWLHRLPGLSEKFVYSNDDMFLGSPVAASDFFDEEGRMICRYVRRSSCRAWACREPSVLYYGQLVYSAAFLGVDFDSMPHHNMDGYLKSVLAEFWEKHPQACRRSARFRYRVGDQLCRDVFSLYALQTGRGVRRWSHRRFVRVWRALGLPAFDSMCAAIENHADMAWIAANRPKMFCLNDTEKSTDADRARLPGFLEGMLA